MLIEPARTRMQRARNERRIDEVEPLTFGDLRSVGDCHPECDGGCSESQSAVACFRCKHFTQTLRNKAGNGFKCAKHVLEHNFSYTLRIHLKMENVLTHVE
ncbi:hypothetical protein TELCIR_13272 [Teladorsagia circumcincta]|uniref:Uncharacterized protein n=1 Tax=Teladorsagia circumcincta TaxID=45464 RepID=A0A2G9U4B2_TELCI|nr:hypothetical protein TELCIR_13272 [Teladorsagia circumcincta]